MGTLRIHPARVGFLGSRPQQVSWNNFDVQLALYALALAVVGILMAYTNSGGAPLEPGSVFTRGLMWLAIALVLFTLTAAVDHRWLRTLAWPIYVINIGLLVLTLAVGSGTGGVSRWVTIGSLQFQFSELAKILMTVVLASYLAGRWSRVPNFSTIVGASVIAAPPLALVLIQPDLGTSLVFGALVFGMLFLTGVRLRWLLLAAGAVLAFIPLAWEFLLRDYQRNRLTSFIDPATDPQNSGYQLIQSQIAVGSGGLFGKGLTSGTQTQLDYLPVQATDFVGATLAEELGFVGAVVMLVLFAALIWRIMLVGWRSGDPFGIAFAAGLASMILFQLLVNFGMVMGIMPITGIPLPFVTHGGASLTSIAIGLGILQSIAMRKGRSTW